MPSSPLSPSARNRRWLLVWLLLPPILCVVVWFVLRGPYHHFRASTFLAQAAAAWEAGRPDEAEILLMNALRHRRDDVHAWRLAGRMLQSRQDGASPEALARAWDLEPGDAETGARLLMSCAVTRSFDPGAERLQGLLTSCSNDCRVWSALGTFLVAQQRPADALAAYDRALKLAPDDPEVQLAWASAHFTHGAETNRNAARDQLERLRQQPATCLAATRVLTSDAASRQSDRALTLWDEALAALLEDWTVRLQRVDILGERRRPEVAVELEQMWPLATNSMRRLELVARTGRWVGIPAMKTGLERLSAEERSAPATARVEIQALFDAGRRDEALTRATAEVKRPGVPAPLAAYGWMIIARCQKLRGDDGLARLAGRNAAEAARAVPASALAIGEQFLAWKMPDEAVTVLTSALAGPVPMKRRALSLLLPLAEQRRDTAALLALNRECLVLRPDDLRVQNNVAALTLLTSGSDTQAVAMAQRLFDAAPGNVQYADTQALARLQLKDFAGALAVLDRLPDEPRRHPMIRLRRAQALAGLGRREEAVTLVADLDGSRLLPEEEKALAAIRTPASAP